MNKLAHHSGQCFTVKHEIKYTTSGFDSGLLCGQLRDSWVAKETDTLTKALSRIVERSKKAEDGLNADAPSDNYNKQFSDSRLLTHQYYKSGRDLFLLSPIQTGDDNEVYAGRVEHQDHQSPRRRAGGSPWAAPEPTYTNPFHLPFDGFLTCRDDGNIRSESNPVSLDNTNSFLALPDSCRLYEDYLAKYREYVNSLYGNTEIRLPKKYDGAEGTRSSSDGFPSFVDNSDDGRQLWERIQSTLHYWKPEEVDNSQIGVSKVTSGQCQSQGQCQGQPIETLVARTGRGKSYKKWRDRGPQYLRDTANMDDDPVLATQSACVIGEYLETENQNSDQEAPNVDLRPQNVNKETTNANFQIMKLEEQILSTKPDTSRNPQNMNIQSQTDQTSGHTDRLTETMTSQASSSCCSRRETTPQTIAVTDANEEESTDKKTNNSMAYSEVVAKKRKRNRGGAKSTKPSSEPFQTENNLAMFPPQTSMFWSYQQRRENKSIGQQKKSKNKKSQQQQHQQEQQQQQQVDSQAWDGSIYLQPPGLPFAPEDFANSQSDQGQHHQLQQHQFIDTQGNQPYSWQPYQDIHPTNVPPPNAQQYPQGANNEITQVTYSDHAQTSGVDGMSQPQNLKFDDEVWYINGVPFQQAKTIGQPGQQQTTPMQNAGTAIFVPQPRPPLPLGVGTSAPPPISFIAYPPMTFLPFPAFRPKTDGYVLGTPLQVNDPSIYKKNNYSNNNNADRSINKKKNKTGNSNNNACEDVEDMYYELDRYSFNCPVKIAMTSRPKSADSVKYDLSDDVDMDTDDGYENDFNNADKLGDHKDPVVESRLDHRLGDAYERTFDALNFVESILHETEEMGEVRYAYPDGDQIESDRGTDTVSAELVKMDEDIGIKHESKHPEIRGVVSVGKPELAPEKIGKRIRVIRPSNRDRRKALKVKPSRSLASSLIKIV